MNESNNILTANEFQELRGLLEKFRKTLESRECASIKRTSCWGTRVEVMYKTLELQNATWEIEDFLHMIGVIDKSTRTKLDELIEELPKD